MGKKVSIVIATVVAFVSLGLTPAHAVDVRLVDVVEVTWPGAVAPVGDVTQIAKVIDTEVNSDWLKFTAMYGAPTDRGISFKSALTLKDPISLLAKMPCQGSAASEFINAIRSEAYNRLRISDDSKRYLVVVAPKAGCIWSGRAQLGQAKSQSGTLILHDSASGFVISHELGHTFGLGHSNFLRCDNAANDGAWSDTCKAVEYGGTIDVMGNFETTSPLNTYHQWRMGYLEDSQIKQIWQSETVKLSPSDFANGVKALYIRDGKAAYWVEYRRAIEGATYKPGLAIFRLDPPPMSSVVSPNPEDAAASEFGATLGTDVWMLNLDTYQYRDSRSVGGSMTALTASTYSGNVTFSAVPSETEAVVTITKKVDSTPPPVPSIYPVDQWRSPNMTIIKPGYEDADTAVVDFEGRINGVVQKLKSVDVDGWVPTYLNPFVAPKTIYLRDLPEGSYEFSMRAIDIAGNKSDWTVPVNVVIDRADPVVTNTFAINGFAPGEQIVQWKGATDAGSGICEVNLVDEDGLVIQSSTTKNAPALKVATGSTISGTAQIFDCIGNGLAGNLSLTHTFVGPNKGSKTGKWSAATSFGAGAIKCSGKCTLSFNLTGTQDVIVGTGSAVVSIGGKNVATIADSKVIKARIGASLNVGATQKVVRLTGSNFVVVGMSSISSTLGSLREYDRSPAVVDSSLNDEKQAKLSKYGFRASDFSQEWVVLPMARGTTLDDPTLDLCGGKFASESSRAERRQLSVAKNKSPFAFLSSEVVRYSSVEAANGALAELKKVFEECKNSGGYKDATDTLVPYEFRALPQIPTTLVSESNRVLVHATIGKGADARQMLAFYQFNGAVFTGLYILTSSEAPFTEAQTAKWLAVAATMAQRLQGK